MKKFKRLPALLIALIALVLCLSITSDAFAGVRPDITSPTLDQRDINPESMTIRWNFVQPTVPFHTFWVRVRDITDDPVNGEVVVNVRGINWQTLTYIANVDYGRVYRVAVATEHNNNEYWSEVARVYTRYCVTYNANGGTDAPRQQDKFYNEALTLRNGEPTRPNHDFLGWGTTPSATSAQYQPGDRYTNNANLALYAVWKSTIGEPIITIDPQPQDVTVTQGSINRNLTIGARVSSGVQPTFQWYQRLGTANNPVGTGTSFTIPTTLTATGSPYYYYCVVSATGATSVTSRVATVTVNPPIISTKEITMRKYIYEDGMVKNPNDPQKVNIPINSSQNSKSSRFGSIQSHPNASPAADPRRQVSPPTGKHFADGPFSAIACIGIKKLPRDPDYKVSYGTGFMVSDRIMLSAAHNIHYPQTGNPEHYGMTAYLGRNYNNQRAIVSPLAVYIPDEFYANTDSNHDFAIVVFDTDIGNQTGWFGMNISNPTNDITITGYPDIGFNEPGRKVDYTMWTHSGNAIGQVNGSLQTYDIYTSDGQSGSPVYNYSSTDDYSYLASAIYVQNGGTVNNKDYSVSIGRLIDSEIVGLVEAIEKEHPISRTSSISRTSVSGFSIYAAANENGMISGDVIGDAVTLIAYPDEGYEFEGWYENNMNASAMSAESGRLLSTESIFTFTANKNHNIEARFTPIKDPDEDFRLACNALNYGYLMFAVFWGAVPFVLMRKRK